MLLAVLTLPNVALWADQPLHPRIDALIAAAADGPLAAPADDSEFLRRLSLDLLGRIPSSQEVRDFLADTAPDKRRQAIDRLLASDESSRHLAQAFDVMLMERLGEHEEWSRYLAESFRQNKPWDQMVREMLFPDASSESLRGAGFFLSKRLENYGQNPVDMPGLVRDVGRLLLGIDVQCAQCHDHLFVDDYKQADYQGLFAYLGHTFVRTDVQFPAVGENLVEKKVEFSSVFEQQPMATGPRLPGGRELEIPVFSKDEAFEVPPDRKTRTPGVPRFRPLQLLAEELPRADNRLFVRNVVNRLWWLMLGRGLVHPLDLHHSDNPPSHPELLDLLADEFVAHQFDVRWLMRELALTEAYQRSSVLPEGADVPPADRFQVALEKPLSAEQILASLRVATGHEPPASPSTEKQADAEGVALRKTFQAALAAQPREPEVEIRPSVQAALFLSNNSLILKWLQPGEGTLISRLDKLKDPAQVADELYLSVLGRMPTDEERQETREYLASRPERRVEALGHLAWALLTSTEFCVNH
ncbi:MAG: DUF1549 domain-containing protein [Pirellulaceae bacterium]|nr:DUF1549 domain-containing protein [Pirellulaceae bacterium]